MQCFVLNHPSMMHPNLQMLSALEMCHSTGIAHRDIKPENILLDDNFQLRMADFGLSSIMEVNETTYVCKLWHIVDLDLERFAVYAF